jgi:ribosomal-protein-alanine N-acetyltransferase
MVSIMVVDATMAPPKLLPSSTIEHMDIDFAHTLCAPLESPRLRLEPLSHTHAEAAFDPLQNDALYEWISMNKPRSVESLREDWRRLGTRMSPDGKRAWPNWAVLCRASGALIGEVDAEVNADRVAVNFGYYFFENYWGRGFATEAVQVAADHLLTLGVHRLVATVTVGNLASTRVLEKAQFTFTRILPANDTVRGVLVDDAEYIRVK